MDERFYSGDESPDVLGHLLEVENEAAALVDEAQREADSRIKAAEEKGRAAYDESYRTMIEELETDYKKNRDAVEEEYRTMLDQYRASLESIPLDQERFAALAQSFFFGEK
ncbi:MAG: hypothetical protein LBJ31_05530 [Treponema sp.]|jgi:vacuolar-type H+-ATPase subunit H|nr:hypothetical protein [Treponema sp.]